MLFFVVVALTVGGTIWKIYQDETRTNCINEKWVLLSDSIRDQTFNQNYRFHVDSSDVSLFGDAALTATAVTHAHYTVNTLRSFSTASCVAR